jgi:uncharacterized glyoxalase superfamily protein PhnB
MVIERPSSPTPEVADGLKLPGRRGRRGGRSGPEGTAVIEGLGYIRLEVTDLDRAIAFYRDGLRFAFVGLDEAMGPRAHLTAGDLNVMLEQAPNGRRMPHRGRGVRLSVDVTGLDAYHDALVARGIDPTAPLDEGRARSFTVSDPDGYQWCFRQSLS